MEFCLIDRQYRPSIVRRFATSKAGAMWTEIALQLPTPCEWDARQYSLSLNHSSNSPRRIANGTAAALRHDAAAEETKLPIAGRRQFERNSEFGNIIGSFVVEFYRDWN